MEINEFLEIFDQEAQVSLLMNNLSNEKYPIVSFDIIHKNNVSLEMFYELFNRGIIRLLSTNDYKNLIDTRINGMPILGKDYFKKVDIIRKLYYLSLEEYKKNV